MQLTQLNITPEDIYQLMKSVWTIQSDFKQIKKITLQGLDLNTQEINWFLNELEWQYEVEIQEGYIFPQLTLEAFIALILVQSKKQP